MKVRLSDIQSQLVKRGRDAFQDPILEAGLLSLNADNEDEAFVYEAGKGNPEDENYGSHKNKVRARIVSVAEQNSLSVSIMWTFAGDCVITLK